MMRFKSSIHHLMLLIFFLYCVTSTANAHLGGAYLPQIQINNELAIENSIIDYATAHSFKLAISEAPKQYTVGESLTFVAIGLDTSFNLEDIEYQWKFGDDTDIQYGLETTHSFTKPGSYFIQLKKGIKSQNTFQLIDVLKINIAPTSNYQGPEARMLVDGNPVITSVLKFNEVNNEIVSLDASNSKGAIKEFLWDFGDGQTAKGNKIKYQYKGESNSITAILRVIDANKLISETHTLITFKGKANELNAKNTIDSQSTNNNQQSIWKFLFWFLLITLFFGFIIFIVMKSGKKTSKQ